MTHHGGQFEALAPSIETVLVNVKKIAATLTMSGIFETAATTTRCPWIAELPVKFY